MSNTEKLSIVPDARNPNNVRITSSTDRHVCKVYGYTPAQAQAKAERIVEAITAWNARPSPDREGVARAIVDAVAKHFTANERAYALSRFEAAERDVGAMLSLMGTAPAELADLSARAAQGEWRAVEGIDPRFWFVQAADEHGHWSDVDVESPDNAKAIADAVNYVRAMLSASPVEG